MFRLWWITVFLVGLTFNVVSSHDDLPPGHSEDEHDEEPEDQADENDPDKEEIDDEEKDDDDKSEDDEDEGEEDEGEDESQGDEDDEQDHNNLEHDAFLGKYRDCVYPHVFFYHYKDRKDTMATIQDQKHQPSLHLSKHQD